MEDRLKHLKDELNKNVFNQRKFSSQKTFILDSVQKGREPEGHFRSSFQPIFNAILSIALLFGFSYSFYLFVKNDYFSSLDSKSSKALDAEVRKVIEGKWAKPFNQFQTVTGSYTFQDYMASTKDTITYSISNKKNDLLRFTFSKKDTSYVFQEGSNPEINRSQNCLTLFPNEKKYSVNSLITLPKVSLKENLKVLPIFPKKVGYQVFSKDDYWSSSRKITFLGRKAYIINGKKTGEDAKKISKYSFVVDKETGFLLKLEAFNEKGDLKISLLSNRIRTNEEFPEDFFDFNIPDDYEPVDESSFYFKKRLDKIRNQ